MLLHVKKAPLPFLFWAVGSAGAVPVLVVTSPYSVLVRTVAVSSVGMAEMVVAAPSETVTTGVTVDGRPVESTVIHASVASAQS